MKLSLVFLAASAYSALLAVAAPAAEGSLDLHGGKQLSQRSLDLYSGKRLIQTSPTEKSWLSEDEIHSLRRSGARFRDITDIQDLVPLKDRAAPAFPSSLTHQKQVGALLPRLSEKLPRAFLGKFTAFPNRYYNSQNGKDSSDWLLGQVQTVAPQANVTRFGHRFPQSSVIARIEGSSAPDEIVVISAHQDSINQMNPRLGRAPGADDDGSGTASILEALRVFGSSGLRPARTVEFHWYAGEEGGLLGSADVVKAYAGRPVVADLQLDMTGYPADPSVIGLVADNTSPEVNRLVRQIASEYVGVETREFRCGYGCSDHASWHSAGFRAGFPFENQYLDGNEKIHTENDALDTVSFEHLIKFSKIALAFAVEVADAK